VTNRPPTIGASEAAIPLGLQRRNFRGEPYASEWDLWARLRGLVPRYDDSSGSADTDTGTIIEPLILARYAQERGVEVQPGPPLDEPGLWHPEIPFLAVRPDGLVPALNRVLEAKAPRELDDDEWGPAGSDEVPVYYTVQVAAQLAVANRLWGTEDADLAVLARAERRRWRVWQVFELHRDPVAEAGMLARLRDWYERHVVDGEPPGLDGTAAASVVLQRVWSPVDRVEAANDDDVRRWRELLQVRDAIAELEARKRELEQELQRRMADATVLQGPGGQRLATWRPRKGSTRIDLDALRRDHPDIAQAYARESEPGRTFRLETR
jgi:predicted phage-related endonuclease